MLTHSLADGHVGSAHFLAVVSHAAVGVHVQKFVWTYVFHSKHVGFALLISLFCDGSHIHTVPSLKRKTWGPGT